MIRLFLFIMLTGSFSAPVCAQQPEQAAQKKQWAEVTDAGIEPEKTDREEESYEYKKTAGDEETDLFQEYTLFDDKALLERGAEEYKDYPREVLLAMISDDALPSSYQRAAAIRVFKDHHSLEIFNKDKHLAEKTLLRRLNRTDSPFVQVEIMHTLCKMDRYRYYKTMIPALVQKLDHYNKTINEMAYIGLDDIIKSGNNRAREARIVFNTLRKVLFLSRKRLAGIQNPDTKLSYKLKILRWSIKVLGNQELKRLPKEVLHLL